MAIDLMTAGGAVLEETTATASDILKGKTANDGEGEQITGTLELTGDAGAGEVVSGKTFYNTDAKTKITGTMPTHGAYTEPVSFGYDGSRYLLARIPEGSYCEKTAAGCPEIQIEAGNAPSSAVLTGHSFTSGVVGANVVGTMPSHGSWSASLNPGGSVTVPWGCHSGGGKVTARGVNINDIIGLIKIRNVPRPTASIPFPNFCIAVTDYTGCATFGGGFLFRIWFNIGVYGTDIQYGLKNLTKELV